MRDSITLLGASLFLAIGIFMGGCANKSTTYLDSPDVFFGETPNFDQLRSFKKIISAQPGSLSYESAKCEYLLERLKDSPNQFIRNEQFYSNARATMHLRWKYHRYRDEVNDADDFAEHIAYCSRKSGAPYTMWTPDGNLYQVRTIMRNELRVLEEELQKRGHVQKMIESEAK